MSILDDIFDKSAEPQLEQEPDSEPDEARIRHRLSLCGGSWVRYFDPATGIHKRAPYTCGLWRDKLCPRCFEQRIGYLRGRILKALVNARQEEVSILTVRADSNQSRSLTRRLDKEDYARYPVSEDKDLFFIHGDAEGIKPSDDAQPVTYDEVDAMDWEEIALTPRGRISGGLGYSKPEEQEYKVTMETIVLDSSTTAAQQKEALATAYKETIDLNPQTEEEVQQAVKERLSAYEKALIAAGGKVFSRRTVTRHFSRIIWEQYENNDIERVLIPLDRDADQPF